MGEKSSEGDVNSAASWNNTGQHVTYVNEVFNETESGTCSKSIKVTIDEPITNDNSDTHDNLKLKDGKDAHFFVSYCSMDKNRVIPMIEILEKGCNVKCLFDERDFKPGMTFFENVDQALKLSMKFLVFLSKDFINSTLCKYEIGQAFAMSMETAVNNVIPVLLEECEIPTPIKTLTYIDARKYDLQEVSSRIIKALREETIFMETEGVNRAIENGYYIDIIDEVQIPSYCRGLFKAEAFITNDTFENIEDGKFNVPIETIQKAIDIVNSFRMRKSWEIQKKLSIFLLYLYMLALVVCTYYLLLAILGLTMFSRNASNTNEKIQQVWNSPIFIVITLVLLPFIAWTCIVFKIRNTVDKDLKILEQRIFQELTMETYKHGVLFQIMYERIGIVYKGLFYKNFLAKRIKEMVEKKVHKVLDTFEIFDQLADELLRGKLLSLMDEIPADAPTIRHPVKGGKSCFCQRLERSIDETYIKDICKRYFDD